ncbi:MAG: hypothetical protein IKW12_03625 [Clostridia bacterium]|nr:hypothetical protein [Clostridia bacterium]
MIKKILAILAALTTVFSLASCSVKNDKTTEELVSEQEAEYEQLIESMSQAELEVSENVIKNIKDIGKTVKNKQIVLKTPYAHGERYRIYIFNKKGICEKVRDYCFFNSSELFELNNEKQKEKTQEKKIDSDKDARMVAFESEYDIEERNKFDQIYDYYNSDEGRAAGYEIIE